MFLFTCNPQPARARAQEHSIDVQDMLGSDCGFGLEIDLTGFPSALSPLDIFMSASCFRILSGGVEVSR